MAAPSSTRPPHATIPANPWTPTSSAPRDHRAPPATSARSKPITSSSIRSRSRPRRSRRIGDNRAMSAIVVLCTCPEEAAAERIASALVEEGLAACVNRIGGVASTYRWQGKVCRDSEFLLVIKTAGERFDAVRERIVALHPYELPEVIAVDVAQGHAPYLAWIAAETGN